jgi:hypothetical protein
MKKGGWRNKEEEEEGEEEEEAAAKYAVAGGLSSVPWGARWSLDPPTFASAIRCHQTRLGRPLGP